MINYEKKMWFMVRRQKSVCVCCGGLMRVSVVDGVFYDGVKMEKLDFCHNLPNTEHNRKNFPLFIDSTFNGGIGHNSCNVARKRLKYITGRMDDQPFFTPYQAECFEKQINNNPDMKLMAVGNI